MISLAVLAVLALCAYRLSVLVVDDEITRPVRERVEAWHLRKQTWLSDKVDYLIGCAYCIGFWLSGATLATYVTAIDGWHDASWSVRVIEWFAVAGAAVLIYRWDDTRESHTTGGTG